MFTAAICRWRSYAVNGLNQYVATGADTFGYDTNGNLTGDGTWYPAIERGTDRLSGGPVLVYVD